ncbi:MAG: ABC-F family ATP-binding cassette domain-containing protein [Oscillospiraceae bacterium]|nr:ABC-F family ATP-binding cassette domain-containing protein [Oscillospiraceae bacterium]
MDRGYVGHKSAKMMARSKAIEKRQQNAIREKESMIRNVEENEPLVIQPIEHHAKYLMQLEDVSISYSGRTAVENINFQLMKGDRLCLRGKNGAGKSTIIKLIAGLEMELRGRFEKASNLKISYVPQDASFLKGDMRSFCQSEEIDETLFKSILRKFGFERVQFEKNMENLSAGQRKKVLLAASLCTQAHIYLWDEPLNYIDISSRDQIEQAILTSSPTMVFIEHERTFCENIATAYIDLK